MPAESAGVSIGDALAFLRAHVGLLLGMGAALGALAVAWTLWFTPTVYQSSAMLTIRDPRGRAELMPVLPLPAYERLLKSGTVMKYTQNLLTRAGVLEKGEPISARHAISSSLIGTERNLPGNTALIELTVSGPSEDSVAAVANAWSRAFITVERRQVQLAMARETIAARRQDEKKFVDRLSRMEARIATSESVLADIPLTVRFRGTAEEINPVYQSVATSLANLRIESAVLGPILETLRREIAVYEGVIERIGGARLGFNPDSSETGGAFSPLARIAAMEGAAQILTAAEPPLGPRPVRFVARVVIAAAAGVILGFLIALAREAAKGTAPPG